MTSSASSSDYELAETNVALEKKANSSSSSDESETASSSSSSESPPLSPKKEKKPKRKQLKSVDKSQVLAQSKRSFKVTTRKNPGLMCTMRRLMKTVDLSFSDIEMEVTYKRRFKTYNKQVNFL